MAYISEFKDRNNNSIKLEITTPTNTSETTDVEVLTLADAMSIEYSGESIFDTLRPSRASVNLLLTDIKSDLFSGTLNNVKVKLYKNNSLYWFGYITPNIYTQSYSHVYDQLSLECVDTVAQLENIDYTYINASDSVGIYSFFDVLKHCIDLADPSHTITNLYVDSSISLSGESGGILQKLFIKERNFFDEKGEPEKCSEVVKAIALYLGLTFFQYKNSFYLINLKKQANSHTLHKYTYSGGWSNTAVAVSVNPSVKTTAQLGQFGSDVNVSLQGVFNKVTVISSNNPLSQILPDFDDREDLENWGGEGAEPVEETYTINDQSYTLLSGYFKSASHWLYSAPCVASGIFEQPVTTIDETNRDSLVCGTFWQLTDYGKADEDIPSVNWTPYITFIGTEWHYPSGPYLKLNDTQSMIIDGGYIVVNMTYKFSNDYRAHSVVKSKYDSFDTFGYCSDLMWISGSPLGAGQWPKNTLFPAKMKIGDKIYNGEKWESYSLLQEKRTYWTTLYTGWGWDYGGHTRTWYAITDSHYSDEWEYVNESTYNSYSGAKESGQCEYAHAHTAYNSRIGESVAIPLIFYYKWVWGDCFFLAHNNKTTETIYDTDYQLTNTVSWKMNLADAGTNGGVAIPCPNNETFYGQLEFEIYGPIDSVDQLNMLSNNPQYRSDHASTTLKAIHISDLSIKYSKQSTQTDIFNLKTTDPDTIFSNIVDESYCKEMEDVTLKVNTQNSWATSYSYVIKQDGSGYKYIDGLTFDSVKRKPEEKLVESLVNYYKLPRYTFSRPVQNKISGNANTYEVSPYMPIRESIGGSQKTLVTTSATYNVSQNTVNITANEI